MPRNSCLKIMGKSMESSSGIEGVEILEEGHFSKCPIWCLEEDLFYPVTTPDEMPEDPGDVRIKANFCTARGLHFSGYIVGFEKVFSIGVFVNGAGYRFNRNLPDLSGEQLSEMIKSLGSEKLKGASDMFPLHYETCFGWKDEGYNNFSGDFYMVVE